MEWRIILFFLVGLPLSFSYDKLSYKKKATQSLTYPGPSSGASNAVDENTATCTRQYAIGLNSPHETVWWKVDLGGVNNIYSITISFKTYDGHEDRQRGRLAGFSLYVSTTGDITGSTHCYKDGPQLPPLEFTTTCVQHGRYVIFYNERKHGITYPMDYQTSAVNELCEVVVLGCNKTGVYGIDCNTLCPNNCQNNLCNIENGSCFGCKPGWRDTLCDKECIEGMYGPKCLQQCPGHCRDNVTCNHVTGQCGGGCDKGWTGALCDKGCDDGTYGYNCVNNCNGPCLNNTPCNKQTGYCDRGCKPGYTNIDCSTECPSQHYGMNCTGRCSGHCINNEPCDHVIGVCPSGCQDGYTGALCTDACAEGYFGANCSRKCSPHCKPETCQHANGSCTCTAGWMGNDCTTGNAI
ncbi:scavenger receptor class F member 1-like [Crassostrea angulata]|uniref:scavenger receptor class F member 1-like n=1 Tax=Magallana angulata TaxID=2784310 RepID=UPI0022B192AB|nr:scavenger receptor class F member 1-like [Crassostrea angulata]